MQGTQSLLAVVLVGLGCTASKPIPGVWRPALGERRDRIPGPIDLEDFGPFTSFSEALDATCSLILSKPNATVGHIEDRQLALRVSTEYCAWLYYTPKNKYELSMLSDQSEPGDELNGNSVCALPWFVDDQRYSPEQIKYLFYVHNHPFGRKLSRHDIRLAVDVVGIHGLEIETEGKARIPVGFIAFISKSKDANNPTCDGLYQYLPATKELLTWSRAVIEKRVVWKKTTTETVNWIDADKFEIKPE
jgi:hypothetical protein